MGHKIKVFCEDLGIWFNSIKEAAAFAKVDDWTMSKKMDIEGSFIDLENHIYKREKPMITKNNYRIKGNYQSIKRKKHTRKPNKKKETANFAFADLPKVVQELIEEKISEMLEQNKPWSEIKDFLKKMGCKKLILRVTDNAE